MIGNAVVIAMTTTRPSLKPLCCDLGDDALHGGSDLQQVQRTLLDGRRRGHHLHGLVSYANLIHRQRRQVFEQSLKAMHGQPVTWSASRQERLYRRRFSNHKQKTGTIHAIEDFFCSNRAMTDILQKLNARPQRNC